MVIRDGEITSEQAELPEYLEEELAEHMLPGESGYVVPWSMWVDQEGKCWLTPSTVPRPNSAGTADTWIARTEDGFLVDVSHSRYRWSRSGGPAGVGMRSAGSIPVIGLIRTAEERQVAEDYLARNETLS